MFVLGMGFSYPETEIDNAFLESLGTGTTAQWIEDKIGILTRRTTLPLEYIRETKNRDQRVAQEVASENATELGVRAARQALERAGIAADSVGAIVVNCCNPAQTFPAEAQRIATALGIDGVAAYDVFTACPAFALHLDFFRKFRDDAMPEYVLCISTATLTQSVNYEDRTDGAIWGDGAAAYVLSTRHPGRLRALFSTYTADPTRCDAVVVDTCGYFHQDGRAVRNFSVLQTVKLVRDIERQFEIDWQRDIFIGHQANYTMLQQITNNRNIDDAHHWYNVDRIGNQAGAGAPAVIAERWDDIRPGNKIIVAVVGAGLSWGSIVFETQPA